MKVAKGQPKKDLICAYIVVQQTTTVSLTGFQVLRTLYKPIYMHKRTKSQNCEFCVFIKIVALKKGNFLHFINFWSIPLKKWTYWSKAKLISLCSVDLFTSTPVLRHTKWKLWTSIKVSHRLGKHLSICFLFLLFFLKFSQFNLKAPLYSKTLHHSRISISRAPPQFRSSYNQDRGNFSRVNVALKKCRIFFLFIFFLLLRRLLLNAQFNLVPADILKNHGVHPVLLGKWAELPGVSISLSKLTFPPP